MRRAMRMAMGMLMEMEVMAGIVVEGKEKE
jgi:hypothetical protein